MPPLPTPPDVASIRKGGKALNYKLPGHNDWEPISCQFHAGLIATGGTGEPGSPLTFPANVGFQPDCDACVATAHNTLEYMLARYQDAVRSQA